MVAIHQFLLAVAAPAMLCPVDPIKSLEEIIRVTKHDAALMLIKKGHLVGTMGIIRPVWWYGNGEFLTDRWHFVLPEIMHTPDADKLEDEAIALAEEAGLPFIHQGKIRKGKKGIHRMMPRIYSAESPNTERQGA